MASNHVKYFGANDADQLSMYCHEPQDCSFLIPNRPESTSLISFIDVVTDTQVSREIHLEQVTLDYRSNPKPNYYRNFVTMGIPESIWERIVQAATKRGLGVEEAGGDVRRFSAGHIWVDVNLKKFSVPEVFKFVKIAEDGEIHSFGVPDIRIALERVGCSLSCKVRGSLYLKKQFRTDAGPESVPWSLKMTPGMVYLVDVSPYNEIIKNYVPNRPVALSAVKASDKLLGALGEHFGVPDDDEEIEVSIDGKRNSSRSRRAQGLVSLAEANPAVKDLSI